MPLTISNSIVIAAALGLSLGVPVFAQQYTPEPPPLTTGPCKPTKKSPCPPADPAPPAAPAAATLFPFPGEAQPDAPATTKPAQAAGQSAFPFPGEPAADMPGAPTPDASSSSSSSSASSSDSNQDPDQPALKDEGSAGSTRFSRRKLQKVVVVEPSERGAEDLEVAHFYQTSGNYQAAYLRAKDATTNIPDDPGAHLALADAALRLNKAEEATAEYQACLKLDPNDSQKKSANKSLAEIASAKLQKTASK